MSHGFFLCKEKDCLKSALMLLLPMALNQICFHIEFLELLFILNICFSEKFKVGQNKTLVR